MVGAGQAIEEAGLANETCVMGTSLASISGDLIETGAVDAVALWDPALAVGGGTLNLEWMQMVSDIVNIEQHIPEEQIGASYGDAFLAGIGAGLFSSSEEVKRWVNIKHVVRPRPDVHRFYEPYYRLFRTLYEDNREKMAQIGKLRWEANRFSGR